MARNEWIILRVTKEEKIKILKFAAKMKLNTSELIRGVYLQRLNISTG